jgi:hypothetical protein
VIQFSFVFCFFQLVIEIGENSFFLVQILEVLLYDLSSLIRLLTKSNVVVNLCFVKLILRME